LFQYLRWAFLHQSLVKHYAAHFVPMDIKQANVNDTDKLLVFVDSLKVKQTELTRKKASGPITCLQEKKSLKKSAQGKNSMRKKKAWWWGYYFKQ